MYQPKCTFSDKGPWLWHAQKWQTVDQWPELFVQWLDSMGITKK
jgi:hypothetical protein